MLGTALVSVIGTGLTTEFVFAGMGGHEDLVDPHAVIVFNHWVGTVPWCWVLAGLSGAAVWAASRAGAAPRSASCSGPGVPGPPLTATGW